jgi:hypothetical protein
VLWEHKREDGAWSGLTDNYLRVHTHSAHDLFNTITQAAITQYDAHGLWADTRSNV